MLTFENISTVNKLERMMMRVVIEFNTYEEALKKAELLKSENLTQTLEVNE